MPRDDATDAEILTLDQHTLEERLRETLSTAYAERGGLARMARDAGVGEATCKNWISPGGNAPKALNLLRLIATCPEMQAEVRRLCGMEADLDPELERDMQAALATFQALRARRAAGSAQ